MATYYVVCVDKGPNHADPHTRITSLGTNTSETDHKASKKWSAQEVINAIDSGRDTFYCSDAQGDLAEVIVATRNGRKYLKTESDSTTRDNLLAKRECRWT